MFIPNFNREEPRIGCVFNDLFKIMNETLNSEVEILWDYSKVKFMHPFFILPFAIFRDEIKDKIKETNINHNIDTYTKTIHWNFDITDNECIKDYIDNTKSYIPISRFHSKTNDIKDADYNNITGNLANRIIAQFNIHKDVKSSISLIVDELVCNIREHSSAQYGYIYAQVINNYLYLSIADNGITIAGSYINNNINKDIICNNEAYALELANSGKSTKYNSQHRGFGISKNSEMIVKVGGEFFILSGGAFLRKTAIENKYVNLPPKLKWNGTIVLIKLPLNNPINIYQYI